MSNISIVNKSWMKERCRKKLPNIEQIKPVPKPEIEGKIEEMGRVQLRYPENRTGSVQL